MHTISCIIWFFLLYLYYSAMRRVDYNVPVLSEQDPGPVQDFYDTVETQEDYLALPGKQIPLDHVDPMFYEMCLVC